MSKRISVSALVAVMGIIVLLTVLVNPIPALSADNGHGKGKKAAQTPIGAWFGIATPCAGTTVDAEICTKACGAATCPQLAGSLPPEVTMMPTLLADGTVLADDFAEIVQYHTTAHGKWTLEGSAQINGDDVDEYRATFIWFQSRTPTNLTNPLTAFQGSVRPRFVTFFDEDNPDQMRGYIQPYVYNYVNDTTGLVNRNGQGFPNPDPIAPLPVTCNPGVPTTDGVVCLGTYHFVIRRIPPK